MNGTGLAKTQNVLNMKLSIRRIGLCWEATRAPRWTRIPQAWAALVAQAGLLRARQQSEKSTGLCGRASSNSKALKTKSKTSTNAGKKSVSLLSHAAFHAEPVHKRKQNSTGLIIGQTSITIGEGVQGFYLRVPEDLLR
jgi:hypothetical protein